MGSLCASCDASGDRSGDGGVGSDGPANVPLDHVERPEDDVQRKGKAEAVLPLEGQAARGDRVAHRLVTARPRVIRADAGSVHEKGRATRGKADASRSVSRSARGGSCLCRAACQCSAERGSASAVRHASARQYVGAGRAAGLTSSRSPCSLPGSPGHAPTEGRSASRGGRRAARGGQRRR